MTEGNWLVFDFGYEPVTLDKILDDGVIPPEIFLPKTVFEANPSPKLFKDDSDLVVNPDFRLILISRSKECDPVVFSKF